MASHSPQKQAGGTNLSNEFTDLQKRKKLAHGIGIPDDFRKLGGIVIRAALLQVTSVKHSLGNVLDEPGMLENLIYIYSLLGFRNKDPSEKVLGFRRCRHIARKAVLTSAGEKPDSTTSEM